MILRIVIILCCAVSQLEPVRVNQPRTTKSTTTTTTTTRRKSSLNLPDIFEICIPNLGCAMGEDRPGFLGPVYEAFMGLPYAEPPIRELRFKDPVPKKPWDGRWDATRPGEHCLQKNYKLKHLNITGSENCLFLNIYRPKERPKDMKYPVIVFIHGGGFFSGSANPEYHGPEYFMDTQQVIVVTIAYRLGPFGFLSTCDENMPGNFGLKDQNLALKFIKKHIALFGGDPNSITLMGHGAGAVSVHLHMLSRMSKGLFHRAILMSGTAVSPLANLISDPLSQVRAVARFLEIPFPEKMAVKDLVEAIRGKSSWQTLHAGDQFKEWDIEPLMNYGPVIEFPSESSFLVTDPKYTIARGVYKKIPFMVGFVPNEGSTSALRILTNDELREQFNENFYDRFWSLMKLDEVDRTWLNAELLSRFYFLQLDELNNKTFQGFINSVSDRWFLHPMYVHLERYLRSSNYYSAPVHVYKFNYRGRQSFSEALTGVGLDYGACHGDDLIYLFRMPALFKDFVDHSDIEVMKGMVDIFVNYAKTGRPGSMNVGPCERKDLMIYDRICYYWTVENRGTSYYFSVKKQFWKQGIDVWEKIVDIFDWCFY